MLRSFIRGSDRPSVGHSGEIGVFGVAGVVMDNYALEVVILAHSEGEIGVL